MKKVLLLAVLSCTWIMLKAQTNVSAGGTVEFDTHLEVAHPPGNLIDGDPTSFFAHSRLEDVSWRINLPEPADLTSIDFIQGWGNWPQAIDVDLTISTGETRSVTLTPIPEDGTDRTPENIAVSFNSPTSFVDVHIRTVRDGFNKNGFDTRVWGGMAEMTVYGNVTSTTDVSAPVISDVCVQPLSGTSAVVSWRTDEPATSFVKFSSDQNNVLESAIDTALTTCHSVTISGGGNLTGLIDIWSADAHGNGAQQWHHGFATIGTQMQYSVGDILLDDDDGSLIYAKDLLARDGIKSDFVQSWVGMHGWQSDPTKNWRLWLTPQIIRDHVDAGYEFQLLHFFLGDYADQAQIAAVDADLIADLRDLGQMIQASGRADKVLVTLQPDWNQPQGDLADWDPWNDHLISYMNALRTEAPGVKVGLIAGNWDFEHNIPISMSRAALQADYFSFQEMIVQDGPYPPKGMNEVNSLIERAERFIRFARKHFMKPVRWDYLLVSDYGQGDPGCGSCQGGWDVVQQNAINDVFDNMDRLRAAGLTALNWMAYQDTPGDFGYYYEGEGFKGIKDGNNNPKPAFTDWKSRTDQEFANRGVAYDPYSDTNGTCGCINDCKGVFGGNAFVDNCGICVDTTAGEVPCPNDCNGDLNGTAYLDNCNICVGGTTGLIECTQDCNGEWGGTAEIDSCGICSGGSTGRVACTQDCEGTWGGSAVLDSCGVCTGGTTGVLPCDQDCDGVWGGSASLDFCGVCAGGTTGVMPCPIDCEGTLNGTAFIDSCGTCVGGTTGNTACSIDCNGEWGGSAFVDSCGDCVGGSTGNTACVTDCNGELNGTAYLDNCFDCVGGSTGKAPCDKQCDTTGLTTIPTTGGYKGSDGPMPGSGIVNTVYTLLNTDANAGDISIVVDNASGFAKGNLMMIIQMQGVDIRSNVDDETWGEVTNLNNCGNNEVVEIDSINGNTIFFSCDYVLKNDYSVSGKTQVVKVPRYSTAVVTGTISAQPWNGTTGGIIAMEIQGDLVVNPGASIDATGAGFRGGRLDGNGCSSGAVVDLFVSDEERWGGEKGESVAGDWVDYDALPGFPGRFCRGAPANGGGGGNCHNAAGGGGANVGVGPWTGLGNPDPAYDTYWAVETPSIVGYTSSGGGRGGYTFSAASHNPAAVPPGGSWGGNNRRNVGGYGGRPLDNTGGRVFLGGGGGAGDRNDGAGNGGGNGGGIVYLSVCGDVSGGGDIFAKGQNGLNTVPSHNDAPGGGGGGGAIILNARGTVRDVNVSAAGGIGGNQIWPWANNHPFDYPEAEGGGGGGGGGYVAISAADSVPSVDGGKAGQTNRYFLGNQEHPGAWWAPGTYTFYNFPVNGGTDGGAGIQTAITGDVVSEPVVDEGHVCVGETYTFTVSNADPDNIIWYDAPVGGNILPCGTGINWTTPPITQDTVFWVDIICPQLCARIPARVFLAPSPVLEITNPPASCYSPVDITASPAVWRDTNNTVGPTTYWFNADTTNRIYQPTNIGSSGTYYIKKQLQGSDCYALDSVEVTINPLPLADALSDTVICSGGSATLAMDPSIYRGDSIRWQSSSDGITWTDLPLATVDNITVSPTDTMMYRAAVSYRDGTCSSYLSSTGTVVVPPDVDGGTLVMADTICSDNSGSDVTLSGHEGFIQWRYSEDNVNWRDTLAFPGPDTISIQSMTANTTIYLQAIVSYGNCVDSSNVDSVFVEECCILPTGIDIDPNFSSLCDGDSVTLTTTIANLNGLDPTLFEYTWINPYSGDTISGPAVGVDELEMKTSDSIQLGVRVPSMSPTTNCITFSDTAIIDVIQIPVTNVAFIGHDSLCPGDQYTFTISDSLGGGQNPTFAWSINGTNQSPIDDRTLSTINLNIGLNNVSVTMTSDSTCANQATTSRQIRVMPDADGGSLSMSLDTICDDGSISVATLTGHVGDIQWRYSEDNVVWKDTLTYPGPTTFNAQSLSSNTTIYLQAIVTNGNCVDSSNIDSVFIAECCILPTGIDISPNLSSFCNGDSATISTSFANLNGLDPTLFEYTWFNPYSGDTIAGPTLGIDTLVVQSSDSIQLGVRVPTVSLITDCVAFSDTIIVDVIPTPLMNVDFTGSDSLCPGEMYTFVISDSLGGGQNPTFAWNINGTSQSPIDDRTLSTMSLNIGLNDITVTMTSDSACADTTTTTRQIRVMPNAVGGSVNMNQDTVCDDGSISQATLTGHVGDIQWRYSFDKVAWIDTLAYPGPSTVDISSMTANMTIYLQAIVTNGNCVDTSDIDSVFIRECCQIPVGIDIGPDFSSFCNGDSVTIRTVFSNTTGFDVTTFEYIWQNPYTGNSIVAPTVGLDTIELKQSDTVQLTVRIRPPSSSIDCYAYSDTIVVDVIPSAITSVDFIGSDSLCPGDSYTFTISDSLGGGQNPTFDWAIDGTPQVLADDRTLSTMSLNVGLNDITVTMVSDSVCADTATISKQIFVRPPVVPVVGIIGTNEICEDDSVQLQLQVTTPSTLGTSANIAWSVNNVATMQTGYNFSSTSLNNNDTVTATLTLPDSICPTVPTISDVDTIVIHPKAAGELAESGAILLCFGDSTELNIINHIGTIGWEYSLSSTGPWQTLSGTGSTSTMVTPSDLSGVVSNNDLPDSVFFRASIQDPDNFSGCALLYTDSVAVVDMPYPEVSLSETVDCFLFESEISVQLTGNPAYPGTLTSWDRSGDSINFAPYFGSSSFDQNTTIILKGDDIIEQWFAVEARTNPGCFDRDTLKTTYCPPPPPVDIPNALTPNDDATNQTFWIGNIEFYPENTLRIYNRWGSLVYEAEGYNNEWDGTRNGVDLPTAVYYYVLDLGDGSAEFKGSVMIYR